MSKSMRQLTDIAMAVMVAVLAATGVYLLLQPWVHTLLRWALYGHETFP